MIVSKNLSVEQLKKAVALAEQIEALEDKLSDLLGSGISSNSKAKSKPEAKTSRYVKVAKAGKAPKGTAKKKGGISEEGRARIAAAQKVRWANHKKQASA